MSVHVQPARKWTTRTLLAAALAMGAAGQAAAVPVSMTQTHFGSHVNEYSFDVLPPFDVGRLYGENSISVLDTDANDIFYADSFDASLGTLERVELTYRARHGLGDRIEVDFRCADSGFNSDCESGFGGASLEILFGVIDPNGTFGATRFAQASQEGNGNERGALSVDGRVFNGFDPRIERNMTRVQEYTSASDLAGFQNGGPVQLTPYFEPSIRVSASCDPNGIALITACVTESYTRYSANYSIELTYIYDDGTLPPPAPVPLPAGGALLLAGLGGLAFMRRRARR